MGFGSDGKNVLSATISTTINAGENKLNFVMQEATGDTAASGSIEFTLNFPGDVVCNVEAKLFNYENNDTEISKQTLSIYSSSTDNYSSVKYSYPDATTEELKSGYYILKIELQQKSDATTPAVEYKTINTYSCLVRVAPGLLSQGKYTLTDLAPLYTINYECNQGVIENPQTTTSYNAYTSFELPEPTYQGHYFAGWYTRDYKDDGTFTEKFFGNAGETTTINADTNLYAKWVEVVSGVTHANNTLYISSYEGLKVFRDIVNGSLPMAITIPANESISGAKPLDWNAMSSGNWLSVELEEDICVTDAWIPIGRPDASRAMDATFDGNNHTITLSNGIASDKYVALFSFVTGTIKNLVVEGGINSQGSNAVAGICACSYGGTFEHCVNKCIINSNTSSGTGGIVGYSDSKGATIKSCVNMGEISSSLSTIGGIVGAANLSGNITIENSINLGKITGTSNVSGIFGLCGSSVSEQKITDCINIGEIAVIPSDDAPSTYAAGIICSSDNVTVSNCISVGNIINNTSTFQGVANFGAINYSSANGLYSNCYYDSSKINSPNDSSASGINSKTTSDLCSLDSSILSNWSKYPSRYPLPNIVATDNLEGISELVWNDICELAKVDTSSSGSSGTVTGTPVSDFSTLQTNIANAPTDGTVTELCLTNDINMTEYLNINSGQNIVLKTNGNYSIYRGSGFTGSFFTVNSGAALTLGGSDYTITLDGRDSSLNEVSASYPFIVVKGDFTFEKKCIMQYNTNNTTSTNNIGGGIVVNSGNLTINEGIIQYCQATKGGGINVTADAKIIVNGGKIVNNAASGNGGGIAIKSATLILDCGSEISGNKSTLSSAIYSAGGGGIYANGNANITLNECIIKDNITNSAGGGVFASDATTAISENAIIQNNGCNVNLSDSCNFYGTWNDSGSTTNYNIVNGQETETLSYLYNAICINIGTLGYDKTALIPVINNEYTINGTDSTGVFKSGRNVTLSPYLIGQYEVTQELYNSVMGNNPSSFIESAATGETQNLRPVEKVSWYQAIVFCNALTKQVLGENNCVYYSDAEFTKVYNESNAETSSTVYFNIAKSGYRLPTVAEWTFAAKGGDPNVSDWNYIYSGSDTIDEVAWCATNAETKTHEVGLKTSNKINIYDMTGNVSEWCWDLYRSDDEIPADTITNPTGPESGSMGWNALGGNYGNSTSTTNYLLISKRYYTTVAIKTIGFRLCRSIIQ